MLVLEIDSLDLSAYVRAAHDQGLDPAPFGQREPQFAGAPALGEGEAWAGDAVTNAERVFPLILSAATSAELHQLVREIEVKLVRGAQVAFAVDEADAVSYFDLERGRLEVDYQHWVARSGNLRATLRLWTRPYANTGTARTVASLGGTAVVQFPVTGILGDVAAAGKLEARVGSKVASGGRVVGFGVHRSASFVGVRGPSAANFVAQSGATVRGASGAVGSQYLALPVSPTGASGIALTSFLDPPGGHVGRHRVFAIARSRLSAPITLWARDRFGAPLGPTTAASAFGAERWGLVDLGEVQVPARRSGQEAVPTQYVELIGGGASGVSVSASPALEVNRLLYLPLDEAPGILRTRGAEGESLLYSDGFARLQGDEISGYGRLDYGWTAITEHGAGVYRRIAGAFGGYGGYLRPVASTSLAFGVPTFTASAFYSLASGVLHSDVIAEIGVTNAGTQSAASAVVELWPKMRNASLGLAARWTLGPSQKIEILRYASAGATVVASYGIASVSGWNGASGIYTGVPHRFICLVQGGAIGVLVGTGAALATVAAASHADIAIPGWPGLRAQNAPSNALGAEALTLDNLSYYAVGPGASDIGPRVHFRFESHPERRAFQGNASAFAAERAGEFRGAHPRVPAVGSPGPSGPAQMVVFSGDPTDFLGQDLLDVRLDVVERFVYLR